MIVVASGLIHNRSMKNILVSVALMGSVSLSLGLHMQASAQTGLAPDVEAGRRKSLALIQDDPAGSIATDRELCAKGMETGIVNRARLRGDQYTPNASESCPAVIRRQIHDGTALDFYAAIAKAGGGGMKPEQVLSSVATAAMNNKPQVSIGGNKAIETTPALGFDAGYTKGMMDKTITMESLRLADSQANAQKLKGLAESCLDGGNKQPPASSACYVVGVSMAAQDKHGSAAK